MIDKYRLEELRRESGEKGELARWVIELQILLDTERRRVTSQSVPEANPFVVNLTKRYEPEGYHIDEAYMVADDDGDWLNRDEVMEAIKASGGEVEE